MKKPSLLIALVMLLGTSLVWTPAAYPAAAASQASTETENGAGAAHEDAMSELLARLKATAEQSYSDLGSLRIEKWKTDGASKHQAQASAEAIQRNLTRAVPELLHQVSAEPGAVSPTFRLYRDMTILCETFSSLVERAGAFGPPNEYSAIATDLSQLDKLRYQLADQLDALTLSTDAEMARLREHAEQTAGHKTARPVSLPTRIVIDENHPQPRKKHWHKQEPKHTPAKHAPEKHPAAKPSAAKPSAANAEPARP